MTEKYWDECSFSERLEFSLIEKRKKQADSKLFKKEIDKDTYQTLIIELICDLDELEEEYRDYDPQQEYVMQTN